MQTAKTQISMHICVLAWENVKEYLSMALLTSTHNICFLWRYKKQEAHGPQFAHLSDIATADMQMLCNIYPILSSQLMKISSFEQFLVLKKNIWAWQSMEHDHE